MVVERIQEDGHIKSWDTIHKDTGCIYTGFRGLRTGLQQLGMCHSRRTTTKYIPEVYLTASLQQRLELLAGLIDTDGFLDHEKGYYIYSTTEPVLKDGIVELLATFGWRAYVRRQEPTASTSGIIGRKPCYSIGFAPKLEIPCVVPRKQKASFKRQQRTAVVNVERCDPKRGNCISVEGGIYCVGRTMVPTHNSTLAGQLLLNAIEQGYSVCAYSGELTKERFQSWIHYQAAGSDYIGLKYDPVRKIQVPFVPYGVRERIIDFYKDRFYLFDNNEIFEHNQAEAILDVFTMVARRYGCKLFLVDNLMTSLSDTDEENRAQGKFVNMLKKFANRYDAHVLLVAHPRKTRLGDGLKQDDVGGNSATIRLADNAIVVERPDLRIIKNREGGLYSRIECCFCPDSRRIYQADTGDLSAYSWDKNGVPMADPRADSLQEYKVQFSDPDPF